MWTYVSFLRIEMNTVMMTLHSCSGGWNCKRERMILLSLRRKGLPMLSFILNGACLLYQLIGSCLDITLNYPTWVNIASFNLYVYITYNSLTIRVSPLGLPYRALRASQEVLPACECTVSSPWGPCNCFGPEPLLPSSLEEELKEYKESILLTIILIALTVAYSLCTSPFLSPSLTKIKLITYSNTLIIKTKTKLMEFYVNNT